MRRVHLLALCVLGAVALTACPPKPKPGECKSSKDCADQQGLKVCVEGFCRECGADSDCREGFACRENRCVPKPQCGPNQPCPEGQECVADRCQAAAPASKPPPQETQPVVSPECANAAAFTIRFEFDKYTITSDAQGALQKLADCLRAAPAKGIVANGYADERGTTQYNIALSGRRAEAARKYLSDLGVGAFVRTVPNGEDNPLCTESTEACWAQNRRVEFQISR
jgi:peptidoglycan-associated lipoprotein